MASSLALLALCLVAAASAAPQQLLAISRLQPQLIRQGSYLQPQLINSGQYYSSEGYYQPQGYYRPQGYYQQIPARRVALQYSQPIQSYNYPAGQIAYNAAPQYSAQPIYRQQPAAGARSAAILRQAQDATLDGAYSFGFESEDGIAVQTQAGPLTQVGPEEAVQTVQGSYSYTAPDGTPITTNWIADENGFRAEGAHLPKAPAA